MDFHKLPGNWVRFLTETNLFIALCASSYGCASQIYAGLSPDFISAGFLFCATLFTYNFMRIAGDFARKGVQRNVQLVFLFLGAAGLLWFLPLLSVGQLLIFTAAGSLSLAYTLPVIPVSGSWKSLRAIPHLKLPVIVATWILAGVVAQLLPLGMPHGLDCWIRPLLLLIQQGGLVAVLCICFDIRDLPLDHPTQRTLPQRFGLQGTKQIGFGILWSATFATVLNYLLGTFMLPALTIALCTLLIAWLLLRRANTHQPPFYFEVLTDGVLLIPLLLFLFS